MNWVYMMLQQHFPHLQETLGLMSVIMVFQTIMKARLDWLMEGAWDPRQMLVFNGNAPALNFEIGTIFHLTDKLNIGFHAYNPVGGDLGKNDEEKLASVYSMGIGYDASEKFFMSIEIEKEENKPLSVNAGLQYKFLPQLLTRIGISTATSLLYFGIGYGFKSMRLDVTASYHTQLGITPGLLLVFGPSPKESN